MPMEEEEIGIPTVSTETKIKKYIYEIANTSIATGFILLCLLRDVSHIYKKFNNISKMYTYFYFKIISF